LTQLAETNDFSVYLLSCSI